MLSRLLRLLLRLLLRGLLSRLLGGLLCLGLLLCSEKRGILMRAIHRLLRDSSCRRVHGRLLLALNDHPTKVLSC